MSQPPLGSGQRFAKLKSRLSQNPTISNPGAVAAKIGMEKYGKGKMEAMAHKGKLKKRLGAC